MIGIPTKWREQGTGPGFVLKIRWDGAMSSASVAFRLEPNLLLPLRGPPAVKRQQFEGNGLTKIKPSCSLCRSSHLASTVKLLSGFRVCQIGNGATGGKRGASERFISRSSRPAQQKNPPVASPSFFTCQSENNLEPSFGRIHRTSPTWARTDRKLALAR